MGTITWQDSENELIATLIQLREYVHQMATSSHETHEQARGLLTLADATLAKAGL